jgi:hypothetical protein
MMTPDDLDSLYIIVDDCEENFHSYISYHRIYMNYPCKYLW